MPETADCLTPLVGLSKGTACFPLPTGTPEAPADTTYITDSTTGLYVDMAEGLRLQAAPGAQAATDLYDRLDKARALAVVQVRASLNAGRQGSYGVPLYQQRGTLGGMGNGALAAPGTRALMSFYTNARREGAWRVVKLQLYTDQPVTDAPFLLDGVPQSLLSTDAAGNTTGLPADGLLIPLDGNHHTLEVLLPDGVRVRQNNFFAGCFGCQRGTPWFSSVQTNLTNITATTPGNGFAITVVEECTADPDLLCFAVGSDEGRAAARYPELARCLGLAVLYKAAELFTDGLIAGQNLSRYTMLEPKALPALADKYRTQAAEWLAWLNSPEGLGQVQHPCFLGPPAQQPGKLWTL